MNPRPLPEDAAQIMADLVSAMSDDVPYRKIDNVKGPAMPVFVARLGPNLFDVGYYDESDHCSLTGPEVELVRRDGAWYLFAVTRPDSGFECVSTMTDDGEIGIPSPRRYDDALRFAAALLREIKSEQGDLRP